MVKCRPSTWIIIGQLLSISKEKDKVMKGTLPRHYWYSIIVNKWRFTHVANILNVHYFIIVYVDILHIYNYKPRISFVEVLNINKLKHYMCFRSITERWNGLGMCVHPPVESVGQGAGLPIGFSNDNLCSNITKNMNNDWTANDSPRQYRFPIPNGTKFGCFWNLRFRNISNSNTIILMYN